MRNASGSTGLSKTSGAQPCIAAIASAEARRRRQSRARLSATLAPVSFGSTLGFACLPSALSFAFATSRLARLATAAPTRCALTLTDSTMKWKNQQRGGDAWRNIGPGCKLEEGDVP